MANMDEELGSMLATVGPRLRALRQQRDLTLTGLAETTGISVSTLSRLELRVLVVASGVVPFRIESGVAPRGRRHFCGSVNPGLPSSAKLRY